MAIPDRPCPSCHAPMPGTEVDARTARWACADCGRSWTATRLPIDGRPSPVGWGGGPRAARRSYG